MSAFWMIGVSFILVWIAESAGVAGWFPIYGATGLLVSMVILSLLSSWGTGKLHHNTKKIKEKLGA